MRRVVVPLDGSAAAESIVPDACTLAGLGGELILVQDVSSSRDCRPWSPTNPPSVSVAQRYLAGLAAQIRSSHNVRVVTDPTRTGSVSSAVSDCVDDYKADCVALTTHGQTNLSRILHGGTAWSVTARSRVPVMVRHLREWRTPGHTRTGNKILVPLDGSPLGESALSLAQELAKEWKASLVLAQVSTNVGATVREPHFGATAPGAIGGFEIAAALQSEAKAYLKRRAADIPFPVEIIAELGHPVDALAHMVSRLDVTHVVLASRGRTSFSKAVHGSTADGLMHRLTIPIVFAASAANSYEDARSATAWGIEVNAHNPSQAYR